jgi:hypothetical protein
MTTIYVILNHFDIASELEPSSSPFHVVYQLIISNGKIVSLFN